MRTEADENYLKEILSLEQEQSPVSTSRLARCFGYSPATITGMLKKLSNLGWVEYIPYQGVTLTDAGRTIAFKVLRRHRLLETFLVQELHVPWEKVHAEAERLEHALSDYLEDQIAERLGHPVFDPHGSPIPARNGSLAASAGLRLADLSAGATAVILEVSDRNPQLLTLLSQLNLQPNSTIQVVGVEPLDGLVTIQLGAALQTFGPVAASQITVKVLTDVEKAE